MLQYCVDLSPLIAIHHVHRPDKIVLYTKTCSSETYSSRGIFNFKTSPTQRVNDRNNFNRTKKPKLTAITGNNSCTAWKLTVIKMSQRWQSTKPRKDNHMKLRSRRGAVSTAACTGTGKRETQNNKRLFAYKRALSHISHTCTCTVQRVLNHFMNLRIHLTASRVRPTNEGLFF